MSVAPIEDERSSPADTAAGLLAAISLAASAIAIFYRPVRLAPFAILIALIAAGLAKERRTSRLAAVAVAGATVGWLVGMVVAVWTSHPIY